MKTVFSFKIFIPVISYILLQAVTGYCAAPDLPDQEISNAQENSFTVQIENLTGPQDFGVLQGYFYNLKILTNCRPGELSAYDFRIAYDPKILTVSHVDAGGYEGAHMKTSINNFTPKEGSQR